MKIETVNIVAIDHQPSSASSGVIDLSGFKQRVFCLPDGTKVYYQWNADTEKWEEELPSPDNPRV